MGRSQLDLKAILQEKDRAFAEGLEAGAQGSALPKRETMPSVVLEPASEPLPEYRQSEPKAEPRSEPMHDSELDVHAQRTYQPQPQPQPQPQAQRMPPAEPQGYVGTSEVGAELRAHRLRQRCDVATVAEALRIRPAHVLALEDGDITSLPGRTYAIGFVRAYAEFLGLGAEDYMRRFKTELQSRTSQDALLVTGLNRLQPEDRLPYGWIAAGFTAAALVVLVFLLVTGTRDDGEARLRVAPVPEAMKSEVASEIPGARPVGPVAPPSAPAAAGTPSDFSKNPKVPTVGVDVATLTPTPGVRSTPLAALPETGTAAAVPSAPAFELTTLYGAYHASSRMTVRAWSDAWLRIEATRDQSLLINRELKAGEAMRLPARDDLLLVTRNAGGLEIVVDDVATGRLGEPGEVLTGLRLDADAFKASVPPEAAPPSAQVPDAAPTAQ